MILTPEKQKKKGANMSSNVIQLDFRRAAPEAATRSPLRFGPKEAAEWFRKQDALYPFGRELQQRLDAARRNFYMKAAGITQPSGEPATLLEALALAASILIRAARRRPSTHYTTPTAGLTPA